MLTVFIRYSTIFLWVSYISGQVIITEVMYNLEGSDSPNEYVELYNPTADTVDLTGWLLRDKFSTDTIEDSSNGCKIPPDGFGLIMEGDFPIGAGIYTIPANTVVMKVDDKSIGNGLSGSDSLYLVDPSGNVTDSLGWNDIVTPGYSIERVRNHLPNTHSNWKMSRDSLGTPGKINSVSPYNIDGHLLANSLRLSKSNLSKSDFTVLSASIMNDGINTITGEIVVSELGNTLTNADVGSISELDTAIFNLDLGPFPQSGYHTLSVELLVTGDQNINNNTGQIELAVQYDWNTVHINEFMARPNNDQSEFIELVTDTALSFFGWSISDNSKVGRLLPEFTVSEKDYIVIAADSNIVSLANPEMHFIVPTSFPALNNNGDGIFIYDMTGHIIDSLVYDSDTWPVSSEVSTEKQRPAFLSNIANHWTQTPDSIAMTPGYPNVTMWQNIDGNVLQNSIFHSPLYPSPNTPFQMEIGIRNSGVLPFVGKISILENSVELTSGNFSTIQSRDTSLVQIDIPGITSGIHPLEIQLDIDGDENSRNDWAHDTVKVSYPFGTVLLNEFLSEPNIDQTEFMEIYFPQSLDLGDWTISDRSKVLKPIPDILVSQNQYLVLAQDSIIYEYVEMNKFVIPMNENWPTLNNSSDGIFIYDMTGQVIDSLVYSDNWPILAGRSTEKFRPDYISNDSSRWALTVDANAMTPGKQNSIFYESLAESGWIDLAPNSFSPDGDGMDDVLNIRYQLPFEQAAITINIFDATGRKISTPYWNRASSQEGLLYWNGLRSNGKPARIGIYILKFEARNGSSGRIWEDIQTVVLAKPL
ncbi:MAG: lamin tail domain-containing protein [Candidatus Marinimicrobia bacterium]|nr:lamin tail domain-containing protein [Candidatus Neomarinimicrobiota bacterium]MBT4736527.1 lamin tail domain-containing protein [Candidatus Neomarinimicrobiota bacterium]MBT5385859.1 lamin tail domain-containing protein [Candidatus Neomarinimicrobiota bacterium]MBT7974016.1 lamin tail domain-containing protein [Candidatus Neomarinimicrobiota bacterium]